MHLVATRSDTAEELTEAFSKEDGNVDEGAIDRLVSSLESRFVSWKTVFLVILPSYLAAFSLPIAFSIWITDNHRSEPIHDGAVSQREFQYVESRLQNIEVQLREQRKDIEVQLREQQTLLNILVGAQRK